MIRRTAVLGALLLLSLGALLFRLPSLGSRPMHGDEAVHAFLFDKLWEEHSYRYNPNEFHGPTLYYAALPSIWLHGRRHLADTTEADYRVVTVFFGAGLVLLLALFADGLGRPATCCAAVLTAISPALVFYSRYYIQETLLAFFTLGLLGCGWRYTQNRTSGWAVGTGLCAGLMVATKETAIFAFAAMAAAGVVMALQARRANPSRTPFPVNRKHAAAALIVAVLAACLLLSSLLHNLSGPLDYLRSYTPWVERAHATELHRHPWFYYLATLGWTHLERGPVWSEGFILALALVGAAAAFTKKGQRLLEGNRDLVQFLAIYTLVLTVLYSAIPYKTPWCVLSFLNGMILLAGVGAVVLVRLACHRAVKALVCVLLLAGCAHLTWLAYVTSSVYQSDNRNPYVYAQPVRDVFELTDRMDTLARAFPEHQAMVVKVMSVDGYYWPLPWYLRRFPNMGYYTTLPPDPSAAVVLASPEFDEALKKRLDATHIMNHYYALRPRVLYEMWIRMDVWKAYLDAKRAAKKAKPEDEEE